MITNGEMGEVVAEEAASSGLELEIATLLAESLDIAEKIKRAKGPQGFDVAAAFLANARGLARDGKEELARRKLAAARNVLAGGDGDG